MDFWTPEQLRSIDKMLNPRSIAVIGATPKGGYGQRLLNALLRSKDRVAIYPVNPNYDEISGLRAYRSVADLPEAPDLAGIVVPYSRVFGVLRECHEKKAGAALIISAGFAERGTDSGADLQKQLGAFARETGLRIAGPNCLGLANVRDDIWATASSRTLGGLTGNIALVCQSGATAFGPFLVRAVDSGIGLSHIISTGNEADLDFADFARYLVDDEQTRVIAGFVEGFKDIRKFVAMAKLAAERGKPIVLIKIGRSESGAQAARSHTAALTGTDSLNDAMFKQYRRDTRAGLRRAARGFAVARQFAQAEEARRRSGVALRRHQLTHGGYARAVRSSAAAVERPSARRNQRDSQGLRLGRESG